MGKLIDSDRPVPITLAGWAPRCNAQNHKRIKIDFELPLTEEVLAALPEAIQKSAGSILDAETGITAIEIGLEYGQVLELYMLADHTTPAIKLPAALLTGLEVFRPTAKDTEARERYLWFTTTIDVGGTVVSQFGKDLAGWLLENMTSMVFIKVEQLQGELALKAAEDPPKPETAKSKKKASAREQAQSEAAAE